MPGPDTIRNRSLGVVTALLVVAALRASYPVSMPLAVAILIVAAAWPIKPWLGRFLPSSFSYLGTVLALALVFLGFMLAVYVAAAQMVEAFARRQDEFARIYASVTGWAERWGIHVGGQDGYARLIEFGQLALANTYTVLGYLGFIALLVAFGLPEVPALRRKIAEEFSSDGRSALFTTADEIAGKVRQYLGVTTVTSVLTGIGSALWALAIGLDLALVWGLLNFLLNFVPVVGNIVGVIPPSLYALAQFRDLTWTAVVFVGYAVLQIAISNFVYPMLQGRRLSISPVGILVSLAFWSWVWGIAGALIAVPLTVAVVIVCEHFGSTAWIAKLFSTPK